MRFLLPFLFLLPTALFAQFRVDYYSGNCYVRTGEGILQHVDKTAIRRLPVYRGGGLHRLQLKKTRISNGFARPAVYAQAKGNANVLTIVEPARESEEHIYWTVRDTTLREYYDWEYVQESWTSYEGEVNDLSWSLCTCSLTNEHLQLVANELVREGDLPTGFRVNQTDSAQKRAFVEAVIAYAKGYGLVQPLEREPHTLVVPLEVLENMRLGYDRERRMLWRF